MTTAIPPQIRLVLDDYVDLVGAALPGLLEGLYLHGSVALGAYLPGRSDIDFIAVTSRRCTPDDIAALTQVHAALLRRHPAPQLEGGYLQWQDLGLLEDTIPPHPHIHDGVLHPSGFHDINHVTWWVLKQHGLAVLGPPADQLAIEVDWDDLLARMHHNLNSYWAGFISRPSRMLWLLDDSGIQWTVLGVLRQFYTFRERAITTKIGAGHYGLLHLPPQWHGLIREAIDIREGRGGSFGRSRLVRAFVARAFLQLIVTACNTGG
ncbi:MAG TPA: aminoglycoside adenylyltransferase domain-containing protein [Roseiflexaceae bacterium]|nr:aminoglycoside adenylyltransferase domain-containing protein [Roseiflexaceae bacterium]